VSPYSFVGDNIVIIIIAITLRFLFYAIFLCIPQSWCPSISRLPTGTVRCYHSSQGVQSVPMLTQQAGISVSKLLLAVVSPRRIRDLGCTRYKLAVKGHGIVGIVGNIAWYSGPLSPFFTPPSPWLPYCAHPIPYSLHFMPTLQPPMLPVNLDRQPVAVLVHHRQIPHLELHFTPSSLSFPPLLPRLYGIQAILLGCGAVSLCQYDSTPFSFPSTCLLSPCTLSLSPCVSPGITPSPPPPYSCSIVWESSVTP